jgi:hypothetical protein
LDLKNNKKLVKLPKCIEEMKLLRSLDVGRLSTSRNGVIVEVVALGFEQQ